MIHHRTASEEDSMVRTNRSTASPLRLGLSAAVGAALVAAAVPAAADATIVPGRSVAGVKLDATAAQVQKRLGKPERGSTVFNMRYIRKRGIGLYLIGGKVFRIQVVRGREATRKRIRIGSTRRALTRAYPRARCKAAVTGKGVVECTLRSRFKKRPTETVFLVRKNRVRQISVQFA